MPSPIKWPHSITSAIDYPEPYDRRRYDPENGGGAANLQGERGYASQGKQPENKQREKTRFPGALFDFWPSLLRFMSRRNPNLPKHTKTAAPSGPGAASPVLLSDLEAQVYSHDPDGAAAATSPTPVTPARHSAARRHSGFPALMDPARGQFVGKDHLSLLDVLSVARLLVCCSSSCLLSHPLSLAACLRTRGRTLEG